VLAPRSVALLMTTPKTYLVPTRFDQWPRVSARDNAKRIDVTGKSEREVERITLGLLRNVDTDKWFVDEVTEAAS
jgi:hypothetical protein